MSDLKTAVEESFARYAGNVILDRAICDVRDMLKPSARMLMYSQLHITKNTSAKPFVKSARVVGDCLGHYYTHGDGSCYSTYMRMAKPFAMRYPLEDCQGNSGTITETGDEAHMRYTELRMSKLGDQLFLDIDKETIREWYDNFDETDKYPKVLPSKGFYNIVNGSTGIGVSLSASIPQFNIKDINNALIELIDNPNYEIDILPDFATGGILINPNEVKESLKIGTGAACNLRSVVEFDAKERAFIVKELPYGVYTNTISEQITKLVENNPDCGIDHINDGSSKAPDYMIYLTKKANPDKVLKLLYKETSLQSYFTINMNVLIDNGKKPKTLGLKEMLQAHIDHEREVYINGFNFDLRKIESRLHIIDGLLKAISMIEEVIKTIKGSNDTKAASIALKQLLDIDDVQAKAILDIKLARLAHLEISKLEKEKSDLNVEKNHIESILNDESLLNNEIKKGLQEVSEKFGDERRTKIINLNKNCNDEPVEIKSLQISVTNKNRLFAVESSTLYTQKRGGVGNKFKLEQNEYVIDSIAVQSNEEMLFFSQNGVVYHYNANDIIVGEKIDLSTILNLKQEEKICAITSISKNNKTKNIIFITKNGFIKKSSTEEYNINRKIGIKAISLEDGDIIIKVIFTNEDKIGLLTEKGNFLMIRTDDITPIGRIAKGVRAIKLSDDFVAAAHIIPNNTKFIASISGNGLFKQTEFSEFYVQNRNTKGSKLQKINSGDWMVDFLPIINDSEILIMATKTCIKLTTRDIPITSRGAIGNKSIKLNDTENVIGFCIN